MNNRYFLYAGARALHAPTRGDFLHSRGANTEATLDGISILPMLTGKTTEMRDRTFFWCVGKKNALRRGDWKLIRDSKEWQLYDLAHDISETTDLAAKEPARVQQLAARWDQWNAEQIEPMWK